MPEHLARSLHLSRDPLVARLRQAWRAALLRYEADRAAGRETETLQALMDRFLVLLNDKPAHASAAISDMKLRAAMAAAITAEVEALEKKSQT